MNGRYEVSGNLALKPIENTAGFCVVNGGLNEPFSMRFPDETSTASSRVSARVVVLVALVAVLFGSALLIGALHSAQVAFDAAVATNEQASVAVEPGDTLWSLAEAHPIEGLSTRDTVDVIRTWNDLDTSMLVGGMTLLVPAA